MVNHGSPPFLLLKRLLKAPRPSPSCHRQKWKVSVGIQCYGKNAGLVLNFNYHDQARQRGWVCLFFMVSAALPALFAVWRKGSTGGAGQELWLGRRVTVVASSRDLCFHKFSPVRHSKAVTPWEHYKLQCIVRILLLYWFPTNQCHMLNTSRFLIAPD